MTKQVKVSAVMTAGRQEITWCRNQIDNALRTLNIPLTVSGGVYYGQCMQKMLEQLCDTDIDYAITIDGDSVFKPEQLHRIVSVIAQESHTIDALAAMQVRRGMKTMLGTKFGAKTLKADGYPVQVDSAHFGLTAISIAKLRKVAKPWFFCQPDAKGEWNSDDKIDSDVWFWRQWKAAGNSLHIDFDCRIGHVEEMVVQFNDQLQIEHIYPADWEAGNNVSQRNPTQALEEIPGGFFTRAIRWCRGLVS